MASYPADFELDVVLKDGEVVQLRPVRPDDLDAHRRFLSRVGPRSLYQRFFRLKEGFSEDEVRHFTEVDYESRMALVAVHEGDIVGVGRYDVTEGRTAEVAFLVEDAYQGRGIGSLLLQHLTAYARLRGIERFEARERAAETRSSAETARPRGVRATRRAT